ncbi:MAG TPA: hypothetical protein VKB34_01025 [Povalibacter sp.]|nr:hypothetical protein [Povalibacter sp.]
MRLPEPTRLHLLHSFESGISAYRLRFEDGACIDSTERFYRLMRACCTLQARVSSAALAVTSTASGHSVCSMRGWSRTQRVALIGIAGDGDCVRIASPPAREIADWLPLLRRHAAVGGLYFPQPQCAVASLPMRGNYVIVRRPGNSCANGSAGLFWSFARERLQRLRKIPWQYFGLYLGEMCYRFNHRGCELGPLLLELARSTDIRDARALMQGNPHAASAQVTQDPLCPPVHSHSARRDPPRTRDFSLQGD